MRSTTSARLEESVDFCTLAMVNLLHVSFGVLRDQACLATGESKKHARRVIYNNLIIPICYIASQQGPPTLGDCFYGMGAILYGSRPMLSPGPEEFCRTGFRAFMISSWRKGLLMKPVMSPWDTAV
jgi:hypothetical protein